jgi:RNA polymerase sigma-70 factor (ECF subfamily)
MTRDTVARPVDRALEDAHRRFFGRLVGWLFRMTGDLELAEDAVASAFESAVIAWRMTIPTSPEAWLRVAARNRAMSALRGGARTRTMPNEDFDDREAPPMSDGTSRGDERLGLLFVCAHPAIDVRMHAPLMLQAVLGVDAARIASVFLTPPATMGQRLSRAKAKIRDAGIRFRIPRDDELTPRLNAVLSAVYAAYGLSDPTTQAGDARDDALRSEAIRLARLLVETLPREPETWGLLSLLLQTESRRGARVVAGRFVPLAEQDVRRWSMPFRREAASCLMRAAEAGGSLTLGRFQVEAAISAAHSQRAQGSPTDWAAIVTLYRGLLAIAPSTGAAVGAASAMTAAGDPGAALDTLDGLPPEAMADYQPYWVCRAHVLDALGRVEEAHTSRQRAIGLTAHPLIRAHLMGLQRGRALTVRRLSVGAEAARVFGHPGGSETV